MYIPIDLQNIKKRHLKGSLQIKPPVGEAYAYKCPIGAYSACRHFQRGEGTSIDVHEC